MPSHALGFYFDYISPYSYLAWCQLDGLARRHDLRVEPRPTLFAALLNHFGHKGPAEISPKRIYMFKDCLRNATRLGVPFEPVNTHPFNPLPALRATLLDMDEELRQRLVTRLFEATWAESRDVGSAEVVAEVCGELGIPDARERVRDPAIKQKLVNASQAAIEAGVFGVPTMIVEGELFWGTDSLPHLERYLAGQDPVKAEDVERWDAVPASARRK